MNKVTPNVSQIKSTLQQQIDRIVMKPLPIETLTDSDGLPCLRVGAWQCSDFNVIMTATPEKIAYANPVIQEHLDKLGEIIDQAYCNRLIDYKEDRVLRHIFQHKLFYQFFGRRTSFIKALQGKAFGHFINRFDSVLIKRFCFNYVYQRQLIAYRLVHYYRCQDIIQQVIADNLTHLLPLVLAFAQSPQQLRKRFGKSLWKKLCHHSPTRNLALVYAAESIAITQRNEYAARQRQTTGYQHYANYRVEEVSHHIAHFDIFIQSLDPAIRQLCDFKSSLLRNAEFLSSIRKTVDFAKLTWVNQTAKVTQSQSILQCLQLYEDTQNFIAINPKWSLKRMQTEHNLGIQRENEKRLKDFVTQYNTPERTKPIFPDMGTEQIANVSIKLLNCEYDYALESLQMQHCIYDAYWQCGQRQSIVAFSLISDNQRTTAAFDVDLDLQRIDSQPFQHYGRRNSTVICQEILDCLQSDDFCLLLKRLSRQIKKTVPKDGY